MRLLSQTHGKQNPCGRARSVRPPVGLITIQREMIQKCRGTAFYPVPWIAPRRQMPQPQDLRDGPEEMTGAERFIEYDPHSLQWSREPTNPREKHRARVFFLLLIAD